MGCKHFCGGVFKDYELHKICALSADIAAMNVLSLNYWLSKFVIEIAKKSGERYPPKSVYGIICSLKRHLEERNGPEALRAPDCKYQKSYDRREISDFILFHLNVPFGELFSKNTIKSPAALSFLDRDLRGLDFKLKLGSISEAYICPSIRFLEKIYRCSVSLILHLHSLKVPFLAREKQSI